MSLCNVSRVIEWSLDNNHHGNCTTDMQPAPVGAAPAVAQSIFCVILCVKLLDCRSGHVNSVNVTAVDRLWPHVVLLHVQPFNYSNNNCRASKCKVLVLAATIIIVNFRLPFAELLYTGTRAFIHPVFRKPPAKLQLTLKRTIDTLCGSERSEIN